MPHYVFKNMFPTTAKQQLENVKNNSIMLKPCNKTKFIQILCSSRKWSSTIDTLHIKLLSILTINYKTIET